MSLHFLLDGYNIIKQTPNLNHGTLESQRQALLNWINNSKPEGSAQNSVTVVFDGKDVRHPFGDGEISPNDEVIWRKFFGSHANSGVKAIFSKGQSADDLIKKMVEQSQTKKNLVVVSNDKDIKLYVRALGASVLSVQEFTMTPEKKIKQKSARLPQASEGKYVSLTQQDKINKELERIWIKSK